MHKIKLFLIHFYALIFIWISLIFLISAMYKIKLQITHLVFFWVCSVLGVSLCIGTKIHLKEYEVLVCLGKTNRFGMASLIQSRVTSSSSTGENNSNAYLFQILLQLNIFMGLAHFHDFFFIYHFHDFGYVD